MTDRERGRRFRSEGGLTCRGRRRNSMNCLQRTNTNSLFPATPRARSGPTSATSGGSSNGLRRGSSARLGDVPRAIAPLRPLSPAGCRDRLPFRPRYGRSSSTGRRGGGRRRRRCLGHATHGFSGSPVMPSSCAAYAASSTGPLFEKSPVMQGRARQRRATRSSRRWSGASVGSAMARIAQTRCLQTRARARSSKRWR